MSNLPDVAKAVMCSLFSVGQEGWKFASMSAASRGPGENITVVLLFNRHK